MSSPLQPNETAAPRKISLTYSLADQSFARTKSLGILNFSLQLLRALRQREEFSPLTVLANRSLLGELPGGQPGELTLHDYAATGSAGRIFWDQSAVYSAAKKSSRDWLFLPKGFAPFLRRRCPARLAVFAHDLMHAHYARNYPQAVSTFEQFYFRASLHASLRQAEIVFTQTEFVRQEIEGYARQNNLPVPRVVCCGRGFERPTQVTPRTAANRRDLLVLTSALPHKLTVRAVDFIMRWQQQNQFVGQINWVGSLPKNFSLAVRSGWQHHARLPENKFDELKRTAIASVYFSDYEGFGLPPVEAALAGLCPVYSSLPATREVMGERGCAFDNRDYESFAHALTRALTIGSEQSLRWGEELLARHDWNLVTARIAAALAEAR
jgi:glycosyltransferase involved in cell wall biosynthesis